MPKWDYIEDAMSTVYDLDGDVFVEYDHYVPSGSGGNFQSAKFDITVKIDKDGVWSYYTKTFEMQTQEETISSVSSWATTVVGLQQPTETPVETPVEEPTEEPSETPAEEPSETPVVFQEYSTDILVDFDRQPGSDSPGYTYNEEEDTHTFRVNNQDQVGTGNLCMLRGDFMQFTNFSLSVMVESCNMQYDHEFLPFIDIHESAKNSDEYYGGRVSAFRHPLTVNIILEDDVLKYAVGLRQDGVTKSYVCKKPVVLDQWVDIDVSIVWAESPNGSVTATIGDVQDTINNISTSASNAFRYYPMWGIYQDGDIGERGVETVLHLRDIRMGDSKSTFKVVPDFNRIDSATGGQPINVGSIDTTP